MDQRKLRISNLVALTLFTGIAVAALGRSPHQVGLEKGVQSPVKLLAGAQSQKPDPVPSPRPVPLPDQQPEQRRDAPPSGPREDTQKQTASQTFAGTIISSGKKYLLKTAEKTYQLDDQIRAKKYEGKKVQVTGSLDEKTGVIHVEDIKAA